MRSATQQYGEVIEKGGRNVFEGLGNLGLQPLDLARLSSQLGRAANTLHKLIDFFGTVTRSLGADDECTFDSTTKFLFALAALHGLPSGSQALAGRLSRMPDLDRLISNLEKAILWQNAKAEGKNRFVEQAFETNVAHLRGPLP